MYKKCIHNRKLYECCKDCNVKGVCLHNRVKSRCRECNGGSFCDHSRRRSRCPECCKTTKYLCPHNRQKAFCYECGGSQICPHNKYKARCKQCGGSQICPHNKHKQWCKECNKPMICIHGLINCKTCILANTEKLKMLNIIRELNNNTSELNISIDIIKKQYNICNHNNIKTNCIQCQNTFIESILN